MKSGVRLWFQQSNLGRFVGHREKIPLELCLDQNGNAIHVHPRLMQAYNTSRGGTVSGWQFGKFEDDRLEKMQTHLDKNISFW